MLGCAATAWPFAARAQQPTMPVIGFISSRSPGESEPDVTGFRQGLAQAGYVEHQNVIIEYRWAENRYEQLPGLAADLVMRQVATPDGGYMNQGTVTRQWTEQVAAIGMPGVKLHSLRHTHASMLIAGGVDVLTVSRRLGHASPTVTLNVYGHLIHGGDDRAAQIVAAAFGSKMVADGGKRTNK